MAKEQRRSFSKEYKLNALRRVEAREQSIAQIARDLGISASLLQRWKRQFQTDEGDASEPSSMSALEEENRRLRREIASLREDREILKKAAAFFAKEPQ